MPPPSRPRPPATRGPPHEMALSARQRARAGACQRHRGGRGGAVVAVSGPHRRPPGPHPPPRRGKGRAPAGARPRAPSPGLPAQVHLHGQARERRGTDRPPRQGRPAPGGRRRHRGPGVRAARRARTRPGCGRSPATGQGCPGPSRLRGPATRPRPPAPAPRPPPCGRPRVLARGDAHQHVPAAGHRAAARQEQGGELAAPPGLGGGDLQPGAPAGGCRPARASTSTSSSATSPSGIAHPRGSPALRGVAVMTVSSCRTGSLAGPARVAAGRPHGPRARPGGPGRDRRPRSALCSRRPVKPEPACWRLRARPDLTRRAESSVDTAGPGRKASRAGRSARNTAFVARCGRSAPPAAARDPAALAPPPGPGRGTAATVTQALTASVLPQPARKPAEDAAALIRPAGQASPAPAPRAFPSSHLAGPTTP